MPDPLLVDTKDEPRGQIKELIFVIQYPDGEVKVDRLNPEGISEIITSQAKIEEIVKSTPRLASQWRTGNLDTNPTCLLVAPTRSDPYIFHCQKTGHPRPPIINLESAPAPEQSTKRDEESQSKPLFRAKL